MTNQYPDFEYLADELKKYISAASFFTIMLKNGDILHHQPEDMNGFQTWLEQNEVVDIRLEEKIDFIITECNDGIIVFSKKYVKLRQISFK